MIKTHTKFSKKLMNMKKRKLIQTFPHTYTITLLLYSFSYNYVDRQVSHFGIDYTHFVLGQRSSISNIYFDLDYLLPSYTT